MKELEFAERYGKEGQGVALKDKKLILIKPTKLTVEQIREMQKPCSILQVFNKSKTYMLTYDHGDSMIDGLTFEQLVENLKALGIEIEEED